MTIRGLPPQTVLRFMLSVGLFCLTALLLPADLSLVYSYQRPQAAWPAGASPEATVSEEDASLGDELCSQWRGECKQPRSLLPFVLTRVPLPERTERHAAPLPALVPVRFFPRKLSPRAVPDDPFLS